MKTFDVYEHPHFGRQAVKKGFTWPAFFFTYVWAWVKGMVAVGFALLGVSLLLLALFGFLAMIAGHSPEGLVIRILRLFALVGFNLFVGFNASKWRGNYLRKRGFKLVETTGPGVTAASTSTTVQPTTVQPVPANTPESVTAASKPAAPEAAKSPGTSPALIIVSVAAVVVVLLLVVLLIVPTGNQEKSVSSPTGQTKSSAINQYVNGKKHGHWVERFASGKVYEGPYVDGKPHGHWVERFASGTVQEGPYVGGKRHGHWVVRFADGDVSEGPFVAGKRHGHWVLRGADGSVEEGPYVDGKKHGHWVLRWADGHVEEGPFVDGKKHGQWIVRKPDGTVKHVTFRNGELIE